MTEAALQSARFAAGEFRIGSVLNRTWSVLSRNFLVVTDRESAGRSTIECRRKPELGDIRSLRERCDAQAQSGRRPLQHVSGYARQSGEHHAVLPSQLTPISPDCRPRDQRDAPHDARDCLFVIPGIGVFMMLFVATPVCVVEQLGPFASMEQSSRLTKGHCWKIFGMLLLTLLPAIIIIGAFELIAELADGGFILSAACELIWNAILVRSMRC